MCDRSREGAQRRGHARDRWTAIARSVFVLALRSGGEPVHWTVRAFNAKGSDDPSLLPKLPDALHQRDGGVPRGLSLMWSGAPNRSRRRAPRWDTGSSSSPIR